MPASPPRCPCIPRAHGTPPQGRRRLGRALANPDDWARIIQDPQNPTLYTNRAMARLKLRLWGSVISDCQACLELSPENMKAYYYLSQAELALDDHTEALDHALRAHELCVMSNDKSLSSITAQVLRCKKERWEATERRRVREGTELEAVLLALMERERDGALAAATNDTDRREIAEEWQHKTSQLRVVFEKARSAEQKKRSVPDWVVDDISFAIMVDPVIVRPYPAVSTLRSESLR